jgi:hypothetical protein
MTVGPTERASVAGGSFEAYEPVQTESIDDLAVNVSPRAPLKVVDDSPALCESRKPLAQDCWRLRAKQRKHQPFATYGKIVAGRVSTKEFYWSLHEVAVCDGVGRPVSSPELLEGVESDGTTEDVTVEVQRLTGGAGEVYVRRRSDHAPETNYQGPTCRGSAPRQGSGPSGTQYEPRHGPTWEEQTQLAAQRQERYAHGEWSRCDGK